jgi:hypothetical protein
LLIALHFSNIFYQQHPAANPVIPKIAGGHRRIDPAQNAAGPHNGAGIV